MNNDPVDMSEDEITARKAIEINPGNAIGYYNLGYLLSQNPSRASQAKIAYQKAIELDPNNPRYIYRLGLLLHENLRSFGEAEIAYRRAIELAPDDLFYYGGLISLLVNQSRQSEALPLRLKMLAGLSATENWYGLAALESILGNVNPAIEYLRRAASKNNFDRQWARKDPDLKLIRDDPRFNEIVGDL